jgi:hypothetical protein
MKSLLILCFFFLSLQAKSQEEPAKSQASVTVSMQLKAWSLIERTSQDQGKINIRSSRTWTFRTDLGVDNSTNSFLSPVVTSLTTGYVSRTPVVLHTVSPE